MENKLWAHSGDSHYLEPDDLWSQILPAEAASRMPWREKISDDQEVVHIDGESFRRRIPVYELKKDKNTGLSIYVLNLRPPGAGARPACSIWTRRASGGSDVRLRQSLGEHDPRPRPDSTGSAGAKPVEGRGDSDDGAHPVDSGRIDSRARRGRRRGRALPRRRDRTSSHQPPYWPPPRCARLEPRRLGTPLGSRRGGRLGRWFPHWDRKATPIHFGALAEPSSTTWKPPTAGSGLRPNSWHREPWIATPPSNY